MRTTPAGRLDDHAPISVGMTLIRFVAWCGIERRRIAIVIATARCEAAWSSVSESGALTCVDAVPPAESSIECSSPTCSNGTE